MEKLKKRITHEEFPNNGTTGPKPKKNKKKKKKNKKDKRGFAGTLFPGARLAPNTSL